MTTQTEAQRLAENLSNIRRWHELSDDDCDKAAAELRRLEAANAELMDAANAALQVFVNQGWEDDLRAAKQLSAAIAAAPQPAQEPVASSSRECPYCHYTGSAHCGDVKDKILANGGTLGYCSNAQVYGRRTPKPQPQPVQEPVAWTDEQMIQFGWMVLCQVNQDDSLETRLETFRKIMVARNTPHPIKQEPVLYQFRWTNPAGQQVNDTAIEWTQVEPRWNGTVQEKCAELLAHRYGEKPCYEVRALYTSPQAPQPQPTNCRHCGGPENVLCAGQCSPAKGEKQ